MEHRDTPRKRRRPPKACTQCRRRKVRCDQKMPCNQCTRLKISNCSYDATYFPGRSTKQSNHQLGQNVGGAPPTPVSTIDRDSAFLQSNTSIASSTPSTTYATTTSRLIEPVGANHLHPKSTDLLENGIIHLERRTNRVAWGFSQSQSDLHGTVTKTRLLGRSHWTSLIKEVSSGKYLSYDVKPSVHTVILCGVIH